MFRTPVPKKLMVAQKGAVGRSGRKERFSGLAPKNEADSSRRMVAEYALAERISVVLDLQTSFLLKFL